ncbi:MAG: tryptophan 7-halogenase [Bacteroidetes bacterium]|nr:tryptophan 7-halogenase [Bacteroidota bacterium]MBK9355672.1 tryptophan 7-halogenase [Bacteroidota bacterium]MBK9635884.1 tryptophan 7-halogenase [Bacteroidota bacterium]
MKSESVDVLVIGAGPAGSVAAAIVKKYGLNVKMVEKLKFPRFVIGESLLPRSMEAFEDAGFLPALKASGFQEKFGAKFVQGEKICDFNFSDQFTKGWSWTWQVPREDFDLLLADEVQRMGIPLEFETTVTDIKFDGTDSVTTVVDKNGKAQQINAKFIIDASGYGRVIPQLFNLDKPSNLPPRKTLFTHILDTKRQEYDEPNRIIIIDHAPSVWIWVIPFSNGFTSVGFVGDINFFEQFEGTPEERLRKAISTNKHISQRFKDATYRFEPRTIEGWSKTTDKFFGDGFVLTGNVTEFLDPIFSSGVTLAVSSSQLAAHLVAKQLTGKEVDWQKEYTDKMIFGVDTFRTYVMAWYDGTLQKIFFAENQNEEIKSKICSVLAGYVWDTDNYYVKKHQTGIKTLASFIQNTK